MPERWPDLRRALYARVLPAESNSQAATVHHPGV
jgi:hypothetical protein